MTAGNRLTLATVVLTSLLATGCFGAPTAAELTVPTPEPAQFETTDQSVGSFFPLDQMVELTEPTPSLTTDSTSEGTAPAGALASSQEVAIESVEEPDDTDTGGLSGTITVAPDSVLLEATHTVAVTGADLTPGADMIVAVCQLGGDPIAEDMSAADLAERASAISVIDACDLTGAVRVTVDDDGRFTVELDAAVGPATAVVAGELNAPSAVFTPIYLMG